MRTNPMNNMSERAKAAYRKWKDAEKEWKRICSLGRVPASDQERAHNERYQSKDEFHREADKYFEALQSLSTPPEPSEGMGDAIKKVAAHLLVPQPGIADTIWYKDGVTVYEQLLGIAGVTDLTGNVELDYKTLTGEDYPEVTAPAVPQPCERHTYGNLAPWPRKCMNCGHDESDRTEAAREIVNAVKQPDPDKAMGLLVDALTKIVKNFNGGQQPKRGEYEGHKFNSPSAAMVDSELILQSIDALSHPSVQAYIERRGK